MEDPILAYARSYLDVVFDNLSKPWEELLLQQEKRLSELNDSIMNLYDSCESSPLHSSKNQNKNP